MPAFGIIIATYRRERLLKQAARSLLAQSFQDWEAIIVDRSPETSDLDSKYIAYLDDDEYYYPSKLEVMFRSLERVAPGECGYHDNLVAVVEWVGDRPGGKPEPGHSERI